MTPPAIEDKRYEHWAQTPIDHFILAGLHKAGLEARAAGGSHAR